MIITQGCGDKKGKVHISNGRKSCSQEEQVRKVEYILTSQLSDGSKRRFNVMQWNKTETEIVFKFKININREKVVTKTLAMTQIRTLWDQRE